VPTWMPACGDMGVRLSSAVKAGRGRRAGSCMPPAEHQTWAQQDGGGSRGAPDSEQRFACGSSASEEIAAVSGPLNVFEGSFAASAAALLFGV